ncbi:MAG: tRNA (adenosine(37)-N6)-threonylcarbamoyltransferase complex transferase subunit TsaD [Deltaproteobacteria bacterium]|nr:tRNA (adenosine(37)-N6)-threonylcarbamoyltransferase complex transferase subunit TsaD [Deltaproteobacteria bacterium]
MLVLGIESSCDETAAAVVSDGSEMLSNVIASQIEIHERYGGVVPEIASRKHMEAIIPVTQQALDDAGVSMSDIEGVAATRGPGLVGSLLVGLSVAKAMACAANIPFVGVNHIEGHIAAIFLTENGPDFPFIALVVSGGHTHIYLARRFGDFQILGQTRDDAAGEAFDKAARMLDLGYPGGVVIDRLAKEGDPSAIPFPRAMKRSVDFSFSGLKTSLLNYIKGRGEPIKADEMPDIVASYQEAIVDVLVSKTLTVAENASVPRVVVCGGVASNSRLRERFLKGGREPGVERFVPPPVLCTDNAAMIAVVGNNLMCGGRRDNLDLNAVSRWPLD